MKILEIVKLAADVVVSIGVSSVVGNAIKAGTPENAKIYKKVAIGIGGFVLSSIAAEHATRFASESIDGAADRIKSAVQVVKDIKKQGLVVITTDQVLLGDESFPVEPNTIDPEEKDNIVYGDDKQD